MRGLIRLLVAAVMTAALSVYAFAVPSHTNLRVHIDISSQIMTVEIDGGYYATWKVSTARGGYYTPRGSFRPFLLKRMHYSRKYDNSPMPHSIFFRGGYAIHGTNYVRRLGRPASHGCVRLAPRNAAQLYGLVRAYGMRNTRIYISN
jgi:lipoprotein-anchoring transpeptidase ErfK/SrfK